MIKPKDIEVKEFKKVALGYSAEEVDIFLDAVYVDFERLYRENAVLSKKLAAVSTELEMVKQMPAPEPIPAVMPVPTPAPTSPPVTNKSLEKILDLAEAVALETKESARKAATDMLFAAEDEAARMQRDAKIRAEDLIADVRNRIFDKEQQIADLEKRYELMRTRVKMLLSAEMELLEKSDIFNRAEESKITD